MTVFKSLFKLLLEIRQLIWHFTLPEDIQKTCIVEKEMLNEFGRDPDTLEPMIVHTAFPLAMHVSRESRHYIRNHSDVQFRYESAAGFSVPFRPF